MEFSQIEFVSFKWKASFRYRSEFRPDYYNILFNMLERNCKLPWRLTVITDDTKGFDKRIRVLPLWNDFSNIQNPSAPDRGPSCYRRLKIFSADAKQWLGDRIVQLDVDCVIVGDITDLVSREDDFTIWGDTNKSTPYNGSFIVFNAGARTKLWDEFHPVESPALTRRLGYYGSDQAWISACLGKDEKKFTSKDGVISYRNEVKGGKLPAGTKIVIMHGAIDPWSRRMKYVSWVKQHWR